MIHVIKVFVCCSDAPLDIRIKSNLVADLLSLTGTGNRFMFCSPTSVLHVALWRGHSLPCGSGRLLFIIIIIFFLQSPCAGVIVQDPYTGEIQGQEKATRQQSRTVRSHLLQFKSYTITIFSPSIFPLSSPSISPSPLPPSLPLLSLHLLLSSQRRPSCGGLSAEQAAIVRESREEYARRGGFVRIFPTEDSWELYG